MFLNAIVNVALPPAPSELNTIVTCAVSPSRFTVWVEELSVMV
jgi:hypothetical protein